MHPDDTFELSFWDWLVFTTPTPVGMFSRSLYPAIISDRHGEDANENAFYTILNIVGAGFLIMGPTGNFNTWGAYQVYRKAIFARWVVTNPLIMAPAAAVLGAEVYMDVMTKYAPHEHHEQPSYWMAIAQAIGAGGVGVGTGTKDYV